MWMGDIKNQSVFCVLCDIIQVTCDKVYQQIPVTSDKVFLNGTVTKCPKSYLHVYYMVVCYKKMK